VQDLGADLVSLTIGADNGDNPWLEERRQSALSLSFCHGNGHGSLIAPTA